MEDHRHLPAAVGIEVGSCSCPSLPFHPLHLPCPCHFPIELCASVLGILISFCNTKHWLYLDVIKSFQMVGFAGKMFYLLIIYLPNYLTPNTGMCLYGCRCRRAEVSIGFWKVGNDVNILSRVKFGSFHKDPNALLVSSRTAEDSGAIKYPLG